MSAPSQTWLITGCSTGFGEHFVREVLRRNEEEGKSDKVVATARGDFTRLQSLKSLGANTYVLDVTWSQERINDVVVQILKDVGSIDVIVNNAGYIEGGLVEDTGEKLFRSSLETNFFGVLKTTLAVLPHFRSKKSGSIVFISSQGGIRGDVGAGPYCAAKFALEGTVDALRQEVAPFGIKSYIFQPGLFRTKMWSPENMKWRGQEGGGEDYQEMRAGLAALVPQVDGNQPGDPAKAVKFMVDAVKGTGVAAGKEVPERLPVGPDALEVARGRYGAILRQYDEWEAEISSTNFTKSPIA